MSVSATSAGSANEMILKAKEMYIEAEKRGDQAAMNAAHEMAEKARKNGGTIGEDKSLDQSKQIVQQEKYQAGNPVYSVPAPIPTYTPVQVVTNYNNTTKVVVPPPSGKEQPSHSTGVTPTPSTPVNPPKTDVQIALDEIGRAQAAYQEYIKQGRSDLAENASNYANEQRAKLKSMGVSDSLYNPNVDLRSRVQGGVAGVYDPNQNGQVVANHPAGMPISFDMDGTNQAMHNPMDGSVVITKGNDKGTVTQTPTHPNVEAQNQVVEQAKIDFLLATVKGTSTQSATDKASLARSLGATLGADEDTALTKALKEYLQSDPYVAKAIQTRNVEDLNKAIWKAKNDWTWSNNNGDETGRKASEVIGSLMRDLGGTLGSDVPLQQAYQQAFPSAKTSPSIPSETVPSNSPKAPESSDGLFDMIGGFIRGIGDSIYTNVIEPTVDPVGTALKAINGVVSGLKSAYDYLNNKGMSHICDDITNGLTQWYDSYKALPSSEKARIAGNLTGTLVTVLATIREGKTPTAGESTAGRTVVSRHLDPNVDANIINRVMELRGALPSSLKRSGNFGFAEVNIKGLNSEFFAHSRIDSLTDKGADALQGISVKPEHPVFSATEAVPMDGGVPYLRDSDTEYKILNDIAAQLGENTSVSGKIKLFTELEPCSSCSDVITKFANKYRNIEIEVVDNQGEGRLKPPSNTNGLSEGEYTSDAISNVDGLNLGKSATVLTKSSVGKPISTSKASGNTGIAGGISTFPAPIQSPTSTPIKPVVGVGQLGAIRTSNMRSIEIVKNNQS